MKTGTCEPCSCELFYSSGGHGGPYPNTAVAVQRAYDLLIGRPAEAYIEVRDAKDQRIVLDRVTREELGQIYLWFSKEQAAIFLQSQIALLNYEVTRMQAENSHRIQIGKSVAYGEEQFETVCTPYIKILKQAAGILNNGQIPI